MSRVLLDTHTVLWWFTDDARLSKPARAEISDPENEIYVSAATAWEIATKERLGKLDQIPAVRDRYAALVVRNGFRQLDITQQHALEAGSYDVPHPDPFDRMLAAQSRLDELPLVTKDPAFRLFNVQTWW